MSTQRLAMERPSSFRRRRFLASHRRRSPALLLLRPLALATLLVGVPVAAALWVATSPRFLLAAVRVEGTERVLADQVMSALAPLQGRHLLTLSVREVRSRLTRNPWIEEVTIHKELPDRLVVEVRERRPAALLRRGGELYYVDHGGFIVEAYDLSGPVDLVVLSTASEASLDVQQALLVAEAFGRGAPAWSPGLSEIEILGSEDFRIRCAALPFPILVSAGQVERQIQKLERILPQILRRYESVAAVDLRFSRQIVIQPAPRARSQEG